MSGLGTVNEKNGLFLSLAGGFIWNRKAPESDPNFATQEFDRIDGTKGERKGARYADLTGKVVGVQFRTHQEYGENINVSVDAGGERYTISISTNNRYSQDMMKALLNGDLKKEFFIKPYDFIGNDKRRAQGISFRQDGEKINLRVEDAPSQEKDWFKTATKKQVKRFFEDLSDWFVAEVEEEVIPLLTSDEPKEDETKSGLGTVENKEEESESTPETKSEKKLTPIQMKKALKAYVAENYEDKELPKLSREEVAEWYSLSLEDEDLPWDKIGAEIAEVSKEDIDAQLDALMPN